MKGRCEELFRILGPFFEGLRKMETKLKCHLCKNLLDEPNLLPCNHIICQNCLPAVVDGKKPTCPVPVCNKFCPKDARGSLYVKEMTRIFNKMDGAISEIFMRNMSDKSRMVEENEMQAVPADLKERNPVSVTRKSCKKDEASATGNIRNEKQTDAIGTPHNISSDSEISASSSSCEIIEIKAVVSDKKDSFKKDEIEINGGISGTENSSAGTVKSAKRKREENNTNDNGKGVKRYNLSNSLSGTNQQEVMPRTTPINLFDDECAFCHTIRTPELYGPIMCYSNGIPVKPEEGQENVIYVHEKCLDWAPKVYYSGAKVMNLEEEIERGEKLICSYCGVKGAVLGCAYAQCRRTYHATCALEIDCSWDSENFKMLCPAHAHEKLPDFIFDVPPDRVLLESQTNYQQ